MALMASFSLWATDPDVTAEFSSSTIGDYFKNYTVDTYTVTLSTSAGSISSGNGGYYIDLGSASNAFDQNYISIKVTGGATISKIELLANGSGNSKHITAPVVGWDDGWNGTSTTADAGLTLDYSTPSSNGSKYSTAEWREIDVDTWGATEIRIYKQLKTVTVTGYTLPSAGETVRVWGIRVWLGGAITTYSVTYKANNGTEEDDIIDDAAKKIAGCTFTAPDNYVFDGWNTQADGNGDNYAVGDKVESDLILYAQWEEIVECASLTPSTSETASLKVGDKIVLDESSNGGKMFVAGMKTSGSSIAYNASGLQFGGGGADSVRIELDHYIKAGTIITVDLIASNTGSRGLNIQTLTKSTIADLTWNAAAVGEAKTISYSVKAGDGIIGSNKFLLQRNNSVYLVNLTISACGEEVPTPPTAIENQESKIENRKFIKDGQLFIEKNGHVYNVFGTCIK